MTGGEAWFAALHPAAVAGGLVATAVMVAWLIRHHETALHRLREDSEGR